jgi:hypothetical protein
MITVAGCVATTAFSEKGRVDVKEFLRLSNHFLIEFRRREIDPGLKPLRDHPQRRDACVFLAVRRNCVPGRVGARGLAKHIVHGCLVRPPLLSVAEVLVA